MNDPSKPYFSQAIEALRAGDRRSAARLLGRQIREGNTSAKNLGSVIELARHIGEVGLAVEAARQATASGSIESLIGYWSALATGGRSEEALTEVERQPAAIREHPSVLHFRANVETQLGRLEEARELYRRALDETAGEAAMATWFSLAMIKTFQPGDPDIAAMERLERQFGASGEARASLCYALGKAAEDCGEFDAAFSHYAEGAALRRPQRPFDASGFRAAADRTIAEFTPENLARLRPSEAREQRSLFVTGLPRSGTTLTEQILLDHSAVTEGAELNVFGAALMPVRGAGIAEALAYQVGSGRADPWGEIGRDYGALVDLRFALPGRVVDKSLGQSLLTGFLLHTLPDARIAWLRRAPEDVAVSCFSTYFSVGLPWTDSLADIADHMKAEDRLFDHWRQLFPDRILVIPYEELVRSPSEWTEQLQQHFGLVPEAGAATKRDVPRSVGTASVAQVRQPITTSRIGRSAGFARHLEPFRDRYYR